MTSPVWRSVTGLVRMRCTLHSSPAASRMGTRAVPSARKRSPCDWTPFRARYGQPLAGGVSLAPSHIARQRVAASRWSASSAAASSASRRSRSACCAASSSALGTGRPARGVVPSWSGFGNRKPCCFATKNRVLILTGPGLQALRQVAASSVATDPDRRAAHGIQWSAPFAPNWSKTANASRARSSWVRLSGLMQASASATSSGVISRGWRWVVMQHPRSTAAGQRRQRPAPAQSPAP